MVISEEATLTSRKVWSAIAGVLLAVVMAQEAPQPASAASPPYIIDVILPLTGTAAFTGKDEAEALKVFEQRSAL
jgi:hypothetical protein